MAGWQGIGVKIISKKIRFLRKNVKSQIVGDGEFDRLQAVSALAGGGGRTEFEKC